ncbi:MAG: alpha/beta hydrolase [Bacteroidota bacterium]|nr:alpha/beta hydrolase [Bacteroidota bacterium]
MTSEILRRHQVKVFGKGTQALLFAHGLACDQKAWRLLTPAFESEFQVILFDYIGSGQTDTSWYDPGKYSSLKGYAADILAICADLGLRDVIFVGHSVSSMIGLLAAIARPDLFFRLIMIGPSPRYINDQHYFGGFEKEEIAELLSGMEANYSQWADFFAPLAMANPDRPELNRELKNSFCNADPAITCDFARVTFQGDNRQDLANLHTPSLILQTSEDIVAPEQVGNYLHEHMPDSTFYKMKATGHFPQLSAPEETIALMKKYLKENDHKIK